MLMSFIAHFKRVHRNIALKMHYLTYVELGFTGLTLYRICMQSHLYERVCACVYPIDFN